MRRLFLRLLWFRQCGIYLKNPPSSPFLKGGKRGIWSHCLNHSLRLSIIPVLSFLTASRAVAELSGAKFLELNTSARASALGEAFVAQGGDLGAVSGNPAGIAFGTGNEVFFTYGRNIQDTNQQFLAGALGFGGTRIGASANIYATPKIEITDFSGESTGEYFQYKGTCYGFSLAQNFHSRLGLGMTLKAVRDEIFGSGKSAFAADFGSLISLGKWRLGASVENLGGEIDDGVRLPRTIRAGAGYTYSGFSLLTQFRRNLVEKQDSLDFGAEYGLGDKTFLRAGYRTEENSGGFSAGLGVKLGGLKIDYAWVPHESLGNSHRISTGYRFGSEDKKQKEAIVKPVEKPVEVPAVVSPAVVKSTEIINIAVAEFIGKNVSQADASIVADFLRTELVNTGLFNVMDRNNMDSVLAEQKFQSSGCTEQQCAVEMGKLLNVKQMFVGALSKLLDTYYITANVVDVETGKITASYDSNASSSLELRNACRTIVEKLIKK